MTKLHFNAIQIALRDKGHPGTPLTFTLHSGHGVQGEWAFVGEEDLLVVQSGDHKHRTHFALSDVLLVEAFDSKAQRRGRRI